MDRQLSIIIAWGWQEANKKNTKNLKNKKVYRV